MERKQLEKTVHDAAYLLKQNDKEIARLREDNETLQSTLEYVLRALSHSDFSTEEDQQYVDSLAGYIRKRLPSK